ncbi:UvrD-helicase domain-containing protein [Undibacterium umbellatum]|uniref:UvrD-helicase domain-containing protein n=1 Tax=Undibacterium umbellatum TaxID=2762300 RepID=UPI001C9B9874|nr:UvrD-helicase domain-containing protein [Undibacterium umbellatum]
MIRTTPNPALIAAQQAQVRVDACLDAGLSFRLEAGAGAGKTYSLVAALKRLIAENGTGMLQAGQKVACITFTEVARDEIRREIGEHPAILVDTIHAFSWAFLAQFQKALRGLVTEFSQQQDKIEAGGGIGNKPVEYNFGFFGVDENKITLGHDDIPSFMAKLLSQQKFRALLKQQFPVIFIDEYQDTDKNFMTAILEHFLQTGEGPQIGLFGDHWQTIYRGEYELVAFPIEAIDKGANFRSVPAIVKVLNKLRPELEQAVHDPDAEGEARFFHTNSHRGDRTNTTHSKHDMLPDASRKMREALIQRLTSEGWDFSKTKILMLTHNALAAEQGYPSIASIYERNEAFAKKEDVTIRFFAEILEPMCTAYAAGKYGDMFRLFGSAPAIRSHGDKLNWRESMDALNYLRLNCTVGEVLDHLKQTRRPQLPDTVMRREDALTALNGARIPEESTGLFRYNRLRQVPYAEVIQLVKFVEGYTPFATQHSVKGAEFENVLVVLGGGWNHYNWPQLLELLHTRAVTASNTKGYHRARNLLYVSISRPMKRLAVLATQIMPAPALSAAAYLFGTENVEDIG